MMYAHAIKVDQIQALEDVLAEISKDKRLKQTTSLAMKLYFQSLGEADMLSSQRLWMTLSGKLPQNKSVFCSIVFDFLTEDFPKYLQSVNASPSNTQMILKTLNRLKNELRARVAFSDNPFSVLARDFDTDQMSARVPTEFLGDYIGYRRSSNDGDVVRFSFKIFRRKSQKSPFVRYLNRYRRGHTFWNVTGGGVYGDDGTLYLFGQAKDQTKKSRGYRIQVLRQLETANLLCGPIISQDKGGPIAARIVLIPLSGHKYSEQKTGLSGVNLRNYLITPPKQGEIDDYIEDIKRDTAPHFSELGDQGLFHYISNITPTVLHGHPDHENPIIRNELLMRGMCHVNKELAYSDLLRNALSAIANASQG